MGNMIGPMCHECPFGRSCSCNEAPGKGRRVRRRAIKRGERNRWRRSLRSDGLTDQHREILERHSMHEG